MLCDFCHERDAIFFIEQVNSGSTKRLNICMDCAAKNGLVPNPKDIIHSLKNIFSELTKSREQPKKENDRLCPVCGRSISVIQKTKRFGCPECYAIFKDEIVSLMNKEHIKGPYTGSMPRRLASFKSLLTDRIDLQAKLRESIQKEDYEKAAVYRDYLKALDSSSVFAGPDDGKKGN